MMETASAQNDDIEKLLQGTGHFRRLIIQDRLLGRSDVRSVLDGAPTLAVDRLSSEYIASKISEGVQLERKKNVPAPYEGYPVEGTQGGQVQFPSGTVYVVIFNQRIKRRPDSSVVDTVPAVALYGDAKAIGAPVIQLTTAAAGDKPCVEFCATAEQAFESIRGRLDLIIRNVRKEK